MNGDKMNLPLNLQEGVTSILGAGLRYDGDIVSDDTIHIAGSVIGAVEASNLVYVAQTGAIVGSLEAKQAVVKGVMDGEMVIQDDLLIASSATVSGRVSAGRIRVEEGATVTGMSILPASPPMERIEAAAQPQRKKAPSEEGRVSNLQPR
jgi:cytoskeletal protein CcmA (bactofilin family)